MKRLIVVLISVLGLFVLSATLGGLTATAAASASSSSTPAIVFDDAAHQAQLIIPTPPCPTAQPDCQWKFVLQIPEGDITVGVVYGTSGTLTIAYPKSFCGVIQADAYEGPPFVPKRGFQHTIPQEECAPPVTTTTSTTSTTTTTTTTTTVVPPVVTGHNPPKVTPPPPPPATPVALPAPPAPVASQLPFTGVDTKPLWIVGLTLVAFGLALLTSASTMRRVKGQVLATVQGRLLVPDPRT